MSPQSPLDENARRWRRVEEICDAALRLGVSERHAYLAVACGADDALRREVEALLVHEETADGFLSVPLATLAGPVVDPPRDLIGHSIAGYDIVAKIGEGGMGDVYRARDRRLGRDVAIKVLPAAVANDRERLKRFEREARLLASVNHAGIGAIYGVVEADGVRALVLELIEGETLSDTLARGKLKVERALGLAAQIADALDHAHRRGITHRDLKPSNIMIATHGVKLLDFGVGKWSVPAIGESMTHESALTNDSAIIGTLHYMAPEQLEGRAADARSDVFSFGAVLYEMLSGRRAFDGPSQASIIAAVLEAPTPRLEGVTSPLGPRLERVVSKCLAKNPDERWQSARDLADELRWLGTEVAATDVTATGFTTSARRPFMAILASAAALVAVAVLGWTANRQQTDSDGSDLPIRFSVQPQSGGLNSGRFDIADAGSHLVYSVRSSTPGSLLHVRRLDQQDALPLTGSEGASSPVFSPDGQWIAFYSNGILRKVRVSGDALPMVVSDDIGPTFEIKWPTADTILLVGRDQPIRRVSADGGRPEAMTTIQPETEVDHHSPELLPSGHGLLFAVHGKRNRFSIAVQDMRTGERRTVVESGFAPRYSPTGHLLFGRGSAVMAVPFDERRLQVNGDPVTLIEQVGADPRSGVSDYRLSRNGTLVFQPQAPPAVRQITWVDRTGRETAAPIPAQAIDTPRVSPDGKQLAFVVEERNRRDIWISTLDNGALTRLTQDRDNWGPLWTPDGTAVVYGRDGGSVAEVVRHRLDGAALDILGSDAEDLWPNAITSDGQQLVVTVQPPTDDLFLAQLSRGSSQRQTLLRTNGRPRLGRLSPDGRWLAYTENVSSRSEIFIQGFPEPGVKRQVSIDGGREAIWGRDGKELFFRNGRRMYSVTIAASAGLQWGRPTLLFEGDYHVSPHDYDVAPDGRFLMIKRPPTEATAAQLHVVVNWRHELLARVPERR